MKLNGGRVVAFQRDWVVRSLAKAAFKAGYSKWWMAESIVDALTFHLTHHFEANAVRPRNWPDDPGGLAGDRYAEISIHFELGQPGEQLNLAELARKGGSGYELLFFHQLRDHFQDGSAAGRRRFSLWGSLRA